ncbi:MULTISPECIES: hypothetical protein [Neobacillus]|uniref:Uncharacterized protein n=1 Tax=Neobacillus rhizophilus TaxID=2833579 RepID=A0A942U101_9BACI|nr:MULTISPECIES: hypothetical protein [Neobacillus]MBS4212545.1 hypothetical protein [Neobacillus rhizophilus]MBU8914953.1 hypothetical protein [Bacillus sp. FJAT-29953]
MGEFAGLIAIIMVFTIPIVAIVGGLSVQKTKLRAKMVKDELELEKLKHQNYLIETEKMRLELEKIQLESPKNDFKL